MDVIPESQTGMLPLDAGKLLDTFFAGTTQQLLERGQNTARSLMDLNTEIVGFINQRATRNREALARIMQCKDLPDLMGAETAWVQSAFDDYAREAGRLMEYNARLINGLVPAPHETRVDGSMAQSSDRSVRVPSPTAFVPA